MRSAWFSIFDFSFDYKGPEPPFIDSSTSDWANDIKSKSEDIKKELHHYLSKHDLKSYFNQSMVSRQNSWRTISLKTWNIELFKHQKEFPVTTALINKYPQIISASFNLLEPHSKIHPHCGDTNAIYRCHLGLEIPAGLPECGFRVKNETREWKNGEWLVFMDAYNHEAWNDTTKERYIFLMDVMRDEFYDHKYKIGATVLTSLFMQKWSGKCKLKLNKYPSTVKIGATLIKPFAGLAVYVVNLIKLF
jgi:aspartyl/asparaginyl beta-hydroxylase (cupin superfamily)